MPKPTIRDLIHYNPDTGSFKWNISGRGRPLYGPAGCWHGGHLYIQINHIRYPAANIAWYLTHGEWPKYEIDHIDRNPANNRLDNLRDVPHHMNCLNRRSKHGFPRGVTRDKRFGLYYVKLSFLGRPKYLGTFKTLEEATAAAEAGYKKQWELAENHGSEAWERNKAAMERDRAAKEELIADINLDELGL